jgi:thiamine monophosphate synthase
MKIIVKPAVKPSPLTMIMSTAAPSAASKTLLFLAVLVVALGQWQGTNGLSRTCGAGTPTGAASPTMTMPKITWSPPPNPFLVVITHQWSCDSDEQASLALDCLTRAVTAANHPPLRVAGGHADIEDDGGIDLISIRVRRPDGRPSPEHVARVLHFIRSVVELCNGGRNSNNTGPTAGQYPPRRRPRVVVSGDWMDQGLQAKAHGIHFKEAHRHRILDLVSSAHYKDGEEIIIGTSAHTVESAMAAVETYGVDYIICGTCYPTESHPEKTKNDVEGPAFPAQVKETLLRAARRVDDDVVDGDDHCRPLGRRIGHDHHRTTPVIAIGGLDVDNIPGQVTRGAFVPHCCADGVAVIRAVLDADDPAGAVRSIRRALMVPRAPDAPPP